LGEVTPHLLQPGELLDRLHTPATSFKPKVCARLTIPCTAYIYNLLSVLGMPELRKPLEKSITLRLA